jgi:hypothetical protein
MEKSALTQQAEKLLERMKLGPDARPGDVLALPNHVRDKAILKLSADGTLTQAEIAERVGCDQSTVSRVLTRYGSTVDLARQFLEANALTMAEDVVENARPDTKVQVLTQVGALPKDKSEPVFGVQVVLGVPVGCRLGDDARIAVIAESAD